MKHGDISPPDLIRDENDFLTAITYITDARGLSQSGVRLRAHI